MSKNTVSDYRTLGFVLMRTNYGEADRILNIITPNGKVSAIARGARKSKSKLAGGIELFSQIDFNIHHGKGDLDVVTGAKMLKYYGEIMKDFERMELAGRILKKINRASENSDSQLYYDIVEQCFEALDVKMDNRIIDGWFYLNLRRAMGEEMNLYRDNNGNILDESKRYNWDSFSEEFNENENGWYGANEIKLLRIMSTMKLKMIRKIKLDEEVLIKASEVIRMAKS
ncbi:DNA repair protein RecO [Candidatus Saccharibacteria bacterium]|nr:DNA repair protein RecO [Candidatus Saccharibacteria bacterium]